MSFKVESPLAKVLPSGQITCILCNSQVKTAKVWTAHVNGRQHRENVIALKSRQQQLPTSRMGKSLISASLNSKCSNKRHVNTTLNGDEMKEVSADVKRSKRGTGNEENSKLPEGFFDLPNDSVSSSGGMVAAEKSEDENQTISISVTEPRPSSSRTAFTSTSELVTPWEKETMEKKVAREPTATSPKDNTAEALPAGFFDDPLLDKKSSQIIVDEEEDEAQIAREIEEVDKQISQWEKVNHLQQQKEELTCDKHSVQALAQQDSADEDEVDVEDLFDWRFKVKKKAES